MALSDIYIAYYSKLLRFANNYVGCENEAENIVQDVFVKLWEKQADLDGVNNVNAYLFKLVKNSCVNHLQHEKIVREYMERAVHSRNADLNAKIQALERFDEEIYNDEKIEEILNSAIEKLPERCRAVFKLSRLDGLKYSEIAERLGISSNTVENQMVIALRKLRIELKEYLPMLTFLLCHIVELMD
ncbi:MAG: RNA polymerase sigma-70 factor [Bacteroidales bacterium]